MEEYMKINDDYDEELHVQKEGKMAAPDFSWVPSMS